MLSIPLQGNGIATFSKHKTANKITLDEFNCIALYSQGICLSNTHFIIVNNDSIMSNDRVAVKTF